MSVQRVSIALLREQRKRKNPHKYGAKATVVDGVRFASKAEADEYGRLWMLFKADLIETFELQPAYELHAPNGEVIGEYVADFRYLRDGQEIVVDVKGFRTPLYRWKKRHVEAEYGVKVEERR